MDNGASSYRRFLDGDEAAFDQIMELFPLLVFFIDRYVQDYHTAEDLAMDVFSDLIVHRHRYNFKSSLKTYLFMVDIPPQELTAPSRTGFTVVEWGGTEIKN